MQRIFPKSNAQASTARRHNFSFYKKIETITPPPPVLSCSFNLCTASIYHLHLFFALSRSHLNSAVDCGWRCARTFALQLGLNLVQTLALGFGHNKVDEEYTDDCNAREEPEGLAFAKGIGQIHKGLCYNKGQNPIGCAGNGTSHAFNVSSKHFAHHQPWHRAETD